ncbi:hypothetical protein [Parapedobacter soli]|uniref:hypothetical protein n=1 Tax=Parapedobacter soli TaxID=416955 RepID=UPI0021CAB2D8|nr:hypothetical protein [Parapedobacter soli]
MKKNRNRRTGPLLFIAAVLALQGCQKDPAKPDEQLPVDEMMGYMASQKGMKLTYTITEGDGLGSTYLWEVTDVKDSAGYKVCSARLAFDGNIFIYNNGRFNAEESVSLGANMPAIYYDVLEQMKTQFNVSFTHNERPIPTVIRHHDPVDQLISSAGIVAEWHGVGEDDYSKITQDYEVERSAITVDTTERIKIGLGEFDCLRLRFHSASHNKMVITDKISNAGPQTIVNKFESDVTTWIALGLGTIRTTEVSAAGISTTELTSIEK